MRLHDLFSSCKSFARCFWWQMPKFEPGSVKRNVVRSIWTVCTTCTISLLGYYEDEKKSAVERETMKNHQILITNCISKAPFLVQYTKIVIKSSRSFGQRSLLTLIKGSLSWNILDVFLSSSWICVENKKAHWPRCVKIASQKISATRKSKEGRPLTFWPKVR